MRYEGEVPCRHSNTCRPSLWREHAAWQGDNEAAAKLAWCVESGRRSQVVSPPIAQLGSRSAAAYHIHSLCCPTEEPITIVQATDDKSQNSQFAGLVTDVLTHPHIPANTVVAGSGYRRDLITDVQMRVHHHSKVAHSPSGPDDSTAPRNGCLSDKLGLLWINGDHKFCFLVIIWDHAENAPFCYYTQRCYKKTYNKNVNII